MGRTFVLIEAGGNVAEIDTSEYTKSTRRGQWLHARFLLSFLDSKKVTLPGASLRK